MMRDCDQAPGRLEHGFVRRRTVPTRHVDNAVVVARPSDGGPVFLPSTAAVLWEALRVWGNIESLEHALIDHFPDVDRAEVGSTINQLMDQLESEGLLERS